MLNKKASAAKNKPDEIIEALGLKPGQCIADIGAGGGYFSIEFAKIVKEEGKVYAIDTGLINSVSFMSSSNVGRIIENVVFIQVKRKGYEFYFSNNLFFFFIIIRCN